MLDLGSLVELGTSTLGLCVIFSKLYWMQEFQISFCFNCFNLKKDKYMNVMTTFQDSKVIPGNNVWCTLESVPAVGDRHC